MKHTAPEPAPAGCIHHWHIDSLAVGGQFAGVCIKCGAARTWPAMYSYGRKYGTKAASAKGGRRGRRKKQPVLTEA